LWVDRSNNRDKQKVTLTSVVLDSLNEESLSNLKSTIVSRIKNGISNHEVLENHLETCRRLEISTAVPEILSLIIKKSLREYYYSDATRIYLDLGGSAEELLPIFKSIADFSQPYFWYLVRTLLSSHSDLVKKRLLDCLKDELGNTNIKIDAAKYLAHMGENAGFSFIMQHIRTSGSSPMTIQSGYHLHNVDTDFALREIDDLCYLILERNEKKRQFYSESGNLIIEILYGLAMKSESDLVKVDHFIMAKYRKIKKENPRAIDLLWYAERHLEQFRQMDNTTYSLNEIIDIVNQI
jgi:hypothetical protein